MRRVAEDLDMARRLLNEGRASLVIVKNGRTIYMSHESGISGLIHAIEKLDAEISGSCVADRVVGKAASVIFLRWEISAVHGEVMSKSAHDLLRRHGVKFSYKLLVPFIKGRDGGICPFEKLVIDLSDIDEAYEALLLAIKPDG